MLNSDELAKVINNIQEKLVKEITTANRLGEEELRSVMSKYGFAIDESKVKVRETNQRILALGYSNVAVNVLRAVAADEGFDLCVWIAI